VCQVLLDLRGKRWLCRGQPEPYGSLIPSIDRPPRESLCRVQKLNLERRAINLFRQTVRFFAGKGERGALHDDVVALMVLRHYGVPSRLLDWSLSPWVAAYFAVERCDKKDGEIWAFDEPLYERNGKRQWEKWPETTIDGSGDPSKFRANLTAFRVDEPPDWFICSFYHRGFPRQQAQESAYTMTARFGRAHDVAISDLLKDAAHHHRYVIEAQLKPKLREVLREEYGAWPGSLFPDSAGAAETARRAVFGDGANAACRESPTVRAATEPER